MIVSHHGKLEFGSPKLPQFPEALLFHYLDDMDSKMECMRTLVEQDRQVEGHFTGYNVHSNARCSKKAKYMSNAAAVDGPVANPAADPQKAPAAEAPAPASSSVAAPKRASPRMPRTRCLPRRPANPCRNRRRVEEFARLGRRPGHGATAMAFSRILIRATNWVGDAVMSLPAIRAVRARFPEAQIAVLARPWVADLYARETAINRVIPYSAAPGFRDLAAKLRAGAGAPRGEIRLRHPVPECIRGRGHRLARRHSAAHRLCPRRPQRAAHRSDSGTKARRHSAPPALLLSGTAAPRRSHRRTPRSRRHPARRRGSRRARGRDAVSASAALRCP